MEPAWAKLNLSLDVLGARPDGFHDLRMVMQSVDLHDDVTVTLDNTGTCRAETNRSYLPCGADNVAVRAAQVFLARAGLTCGVHIRLHKRIPVCAGLGGGSSDEFNWNEKRKKSYFSYEDRKRMLEAIRYVDLVIPEESWDQKVTDVDKYHVDVFVMGDDWKGKFDFLKDKCEVVYLPRTPEISTTKIKTDLHT